MNRKFDLGKAVAMILLVNLTQIALIAAVLFFMMDAGEGLNLLQNPWVILLLCVILAAVVVNSLTAFRNRSGLVDADHQLQILKDTFSRLETMNNTLRAQRHDFMNHLQVIYSLIEMDEYKSAAEYIKKIRFAHDLKPKTFNPAQIPHISHSP